MAWGRRCEIGCESWPDEDQYKACPLCGDPAERYGNLEPLSPSEAKHRVFEAFYEQHCHDLGIPVDGPLHEDPRPQPEGGAWVGSGSVQDFSVQPT
jgi:hypothetical protein